MHQWKTVLEESRADATEPLQPIQPEHWISVNGNVFVPRGGEIVCDTIEAESRLPGLPLLRPVLNRDGTDHAGLLRTVLASLPPPYAYPTPLEMYAYILSRLLSYKWAQWRSMTLDDMNDHLPSGRPPDPTKPPAPRAPAASL